jgi:hypothetical protein
VILSNGHTVSFYQSSPAGEVDYATDLNVLIGQTPPKELPKIAFCKIANIKFFPLQAAAIAKLSSQARTVCDETRCSWRPADVKLSDGKLLSRVLLDVRHRK